jgi:hypothetical protein
MMTNAFNCVTVWHKLQYPHSHDQKVALNPKCVILSAELCISRINFTVEPPFGVPQFKVSPHLMLNFNDPKSVFLVLNFLHLRYSPYPKKC